jgi:CRISPR-associated protein (TIGR02710 family)
MATKRPRKVLIATVGGTPDPIVKTIEHHRPDFVYFVCSQVVDRGAGQGAAVLPAGPGRPTGTPTSPLVDGPPNPTGEGKPSIVTRAGLTPDRYAKVEIPLERIDDIKTVYTAVLDTFERALGQAPLVHIVADYTGGTKSMTSALVRAGTGRYAAECRLSVVTGDREGAGDVRSGTERVSEHDPLPITLEDQWDEALRLCNGYQYSAGAAVLEKLVQSPHATNQLRERAKALRALCRVFDQWDSFQYRSASKRRADNEDEIGTLMDGWKPALDLLAGGPATEWNAACLLQVHDVLYNAARRATQGRYDDALIRLYRAVEMIAQIRLRARYAIDVNDLDETKLPQGWLERRGTRRGTKMRTGGLADNYDLLSWLKDSHGDGDYVSALYYRTYREDLDSKVVDARNQSILVHGTRASTVQHYQEASELVRTFLQHVERGAGLQPATMQQFPHLTKEAFL